MYVCMHICMYMYVCICMYVCMYVCMHICMYVFICVCRYVCRYVFRYVCLPVFSLTFNTGCSNKLLHNVSTHTYVRTLHTHAYTHACALTQTHTERR